MTPKPTRVDLDGRVFYISTTRAGHTLVVERLLSESDKLFTRYHYNQTRFHSGGGRQPSAIARRVLEKANGPHTP